MNMNKVFYEDFQQDKSQFENIFLKEPKTQVELDKQNTDMAAYLNMVEERLTSNVAYDNDLKSMERLSQMNIDSSTMEMESIEHDSQHVESLCKQHMVGMYCIYYHMCENTHT